ncbi:MAG: hypothetical protein E7654_01115 [Ruminococcaceae bacterium]|nr:hypothetical protein [Oscillospiraceae bacterium]
MRIWGTLILCFFLLYLCGCTADRPADPGAVAEAMVEAGGGASGRLYVYDARNVDGEEGSADVMPESLVAAAFGDGGDGEVFASLEAYGIYLSGFAAPVEYGCLIAARERDAETVAALCLQRMAAIGRLCGEEYVAVPPLVMGRCVFYAVGEGAEVALEAARTMMRQR